MKKKGVNFRMRGKKLIQGASVCNNNSESNTLYFPTSDKNEAELDYPSEKK